MKRIVYMLYLFVLLLSGCHGDFSNLGDGYVYVNGEIGKRESGGGLGYFPYKSLVPVHVMNYNYDSKYVIVYQIPEIDWFDDKKRYAPQKDIDSLQSLYKKMIAIRHCYWIICKQDGKVYGPLNKEEFALKCDSMNCNLYLDPKYESDYVPRTCPHGIGGTGF